MREYVRQFRLQVEKVSVPERTMRFETAYGDQVQMDWGFVQYKEQASERLKLLAVLVMICGTSRIRYVEFFSNARQENLFIGMIHSFQHFGGLVKTILTDNMKRMVQTRTKTSIQFNRKYEVFMAEFGFSTRLCQVHMARIKGPRCAINRPECGKKAVGVTRSPE